MKKQPLLLLLVSMLFLAACKVRPVAEQSPTHPVPDVLGVSPTNLSRANDFPYRPSQTKIFDLIHTSLKVSFDWEKQRMDGEAILTMRPWFDPVSSLTLDAKGFLLHQVALETGTGRKKLKYTYDNEKLTIDLEKSYSRTDTLKIFIDYTARPAELQGLVSEEAAEDQGLYFINPSGEIAGKPRQIWTQGESHGSPAWFPTFDTPNQRCTDDIYITVADSFKTLSNGILADVKQNGNGTRTDHWRMDLPHSPYLFMMAIGNYAIVKDSWRGREVSYYVEPAYEQYARLIFGHTPEMMEFFSQRLGVDFPWPKYSQVVVRDFVSGAMENTSATTHYGRLQHDAREHLDATEEDIISHELFHQWFGDLVTCESWANLSLNEGFATYGEYLWKAHKYGREEAARHLLNDRGAYLRQASRQAYPIIRYHHQNADAMFDAHTYQKGGQVLHMLRNLVGDEAFFESLKRYLNNNAFDDVEIHKLRLAFEEVTGQDLNWFFEQWFLQPGHPELEMRHKYANGVYSLQIVQKQDLTQSPVFKLPITLEFVNGDKHNRTDVWLLTADSTFEFQINAAPSYVVFDPDEVLLCQKRGIFGVKPNAWAAQLKEGQTYSQLEQAVEHLKGGFDDLEENPDFLALMDSKDWATRMLILTDLYELEDGPVPVIAELALKLLDDPKSAVRVAAVDFFSEQQNTLHYKDNEGLRLRAVAALEGKIADSSYVVSRSALDALYQLDSMKGRVLAEELSKTNEKHLYVTIARILRSARSPLAMPFVEGLLQDPSIPSGLKSGLLRGFGQWLAQGSTADIAEGQSLLMEIMSHESDRWLRFFSIQALLELPTNADLQKKVQALAAKEKDEVLLSAMQRYLKTN